MIELIRNRRSVRNYQDKDLGREAIQILEETVLRSPSSRSINPWEFVFVDDRELLAELSRAKTHGSSFLKQAALGIVILGDETKSDVWVEDCSIAAIFVQLAAQSLGLGSCWVQIRKRLHAGEVTSEKFVQDLLGIPEHLRVECIMAVGHPAEDKPGHPADSLDFGKIKRNRYS